MSKLLIPGILQQQCNAQQGGGGGCASMDWNDISGMFPQVTNYQSFNIGDNIHISWAGTGSPIVYFDYFENGSQVNQSNILSNNTVYELDGETIHGTSITDTYDSIAFQIGAPPGTTVTGTMTIKCGSSSGSTIDTFTYNVTEPGGL